ncbi:hypothetical protein SPRG_01073 [Saprolegnia parasitica CBS 223.65]|uniref:Uncharacterized protein n=1 Tax=Saprolegnia parasitica (strain CBS 223.65) TaxID=695850 RepID=A0A067D0G8_SAPPC|nr:hypothetical protein SPRG_01073 [Saprolegnia parasitica CBS 223.65]KDO35010.1 hypothetical protein SPRG_01073 [Saprolegnia parasitica CBS 223.65]|eukprot:XP_012194663.1 hypothetical protein SPRG_01073 [Saprolegnia parasitica CBS 223.65]
MGSIFSTSSTPAAGTDVGSERLHEDAARKDAGCDESAGGATKNKATAGDNSDKAVRSLAGSEDASTAGTSSPQANLETASLLLGLQHISEALYEALSDDDAGDDTTAMDHSKSCLGKREAPSVEHNAPAKRQRVVYSTSLALPAPDDACSPLRFLPLDAVWSDHMPNENVHALDTPASPKAVAEAANCPFA